MVLQPTEPQEEENPTLSSRHACWDNQALGTAPGGFTIWSPVLLPLHRLSGPGWRVVHAFGDPFPALRSINGQTNMANGLVDVGTGTGSHTTRGHKAHTFHNPQGPRLHVQGCVVNWIQPGTTGDCASHAGGGGGGGQFSSAQWDHQAQLGSWPHVWQSVLCGCWVTSPWSTMLGHAAPSKLTGLAWHLSNWPDEWWTQLKWWNKWWIIRGGGVVACQGWRQQARCGLQHGVRFSGLPHEGVILWQRSAAERLW